MATIGLTTAEERRLDADLESRFVLGRDWGGVAAGAIAGLATALLLTTLGGALGLSAGAAAIDEASSPGGAAAAFGVGAAIWAGLTAIATGIVGGTVFACTARTTALARPGVGAMVTWALGVVLAVMLASTSTVGAMSATGTAAGQWLGSGEVRASNVRGSAVGTDARTSISEAERRDLAESAASAAATAAWVLFASQVLGLIATLAATKAAARRTSDVVHTNMATHPV